MVQALERLEIPFPTYHALARIAKSHNSTPLKVIEGWIAQHETQETRQSLRQEYQQLIEKDLSHSLTPDEEKRLDAVCDGLNTLEAQSQNNATWQQQTGAIDEQLTQIHRLLVALPERATTP